MAHNLRLRHKMVRSIRRFLEDQHDFIEVRLFWDMCAACVRVLGCVGGVGGG